MDNKLDKIAEDVAEIKTHLAVYNEQLKIHIKRSNALEAKIEPIEKHVHYVQGVGGFLTILAAVAAILALFH